MVCRVFFLSVIMRFIFCFLFFGKHIALKAMLNCFVF